MSDYTKGMDAGLGIGLATFGLVILVANGRWVPGAGDGLALLAGGAIYLLACWRHSLAKGEP